MSMIPRRVCAGCQRRNWDAGYVPRMAIYQTNDGRWWCREHYYPQDDENGEIEKHAEALGEHTIDLMRSVLTKHNIGIIEGALETKRREREIADHLREILAECELYVTAYKCQANPPRTRDEASVLLGRIRDALKTANDRVERPDAALCGRSGRTTGCAADD